MTSSAAWAAGVIDPGHSFYVRQKGMPFPNPPDNIYSPLMSCFESNYQMLIDTQTYSFQRARHAPECEAVYGTLLRIMKRKEIRQKVKKRVLTF